MLVSVLMVVVVVLMSVLMVVTAAFALFVMMSALRADDLIEEFFLQRLA